MYGRSDMTSQTGSAYKANLDAVTAALAGIFGKRRNINGDGAINQLVTAVALSTSWQYVLDMWEVEAKASGASGNFGQISDSAFPAGVGIGTSALTTTGAVAIAFRTKLESRSVRDLLSAPYLYPVATPAHPFAAVGLLAYQDSGATVQVTPTLLSADAADNFSSMSHALVGPSLSLPSGVLTQLWWDEASGAFQLDSLTNAINGLCLEIDVAMGAGLSAKNLRIGDVQFEGGQIASYYGRRLPGDELEDCQRFYAKTFPLATGPAQNVGTGSTWMTPQGVGASTAQKGNFWAFPTRMIKAPTITFFNPGAANAQARNLDVPADCTATAADIVGEWGASFNTTSPAASVAGQRLAVHMTADARL